MPFDTVLTLLNVVWGLVLTGIGIEMVNNPPGDVRWKRWFYRVLFIIFGFAVIATTAYQSVRNASEQQQLKADAQKTEKELSNKVSEQGGKLDAIAHFEQQFLTFVSQSQRSSGGAPDAQTKAYEAMALSVMKMAQGSGASSSPDVHLHILYNKSELNGQTIRVPFAAQGSGAKMFQLLPFNVHNSGSHISNAVSVRVYLSKQVQSLSQWMVTPSDEADFPVCFYEGGAIAPIYINAQETWNFNEFSGVIQNQNMDSNEVAVRVKVFYGADKPVIANFTIRPAS